MQVFLDPTAISVHNMRKSKKTEQINIRFTERSVGEIDRIADVEERDRSELVRIFVDWAISQYDIAGSLRVLRTATLMPASTSQVVPTSYISESIRHDTVKALLAEERITGEEAEALLGKPKEKPVQKHSRSKTS